MDPRAAIQALRDPEERTGAVTANARLMAQALRNRQAYERPQAQGASGALEYGAGMLAAVPGIGDVLGFANDVNQMRQNPEQRTGMNMGLAALGLIPFVPPAMSYGLGKLAKARGVNITPPPAGPAASQAGAIVYHGSPHKFDRFDSSKIGTGEGAQAYGHGLYLAENPSVAKSYQFIDAKIDPDVVKYGGRRLETLYTNAQRAQDMAHRMPNGPAKNAAIAKANAELGLWESMMTRNHPKQVIDDALDPSLGWPEQADFAKSLRLDKFSGVDMSPGGFYKVDLPDPMIARMLDWDKPLSQQGAISSALTPQSMGLQYRQLPNGSHAFVNEAGKPVGILQRGGTQDGFAQNWMESVVGGSGRDVYNNLNNSLPSSGSTVASAVLRQAGIPGIRYLDGGSRAAGEGTSNFVVFPGEEQALRILRRE